MMKGLITIPGVQDLQRAYELLLYSKPNPPGPSELALFSQWARFDPRLAEIWVSYVLKNWKRLQPVELHEQLRLQPWPEAAAVLLEFVADVVVEQRSETRLFRQWKGLVTLGFKPASWQQFFIGLRRVGGTAMIEDARLSLREYRKWGYLSREVLFNKKKSAGTCSLDRGTRLRILRELVEQSPRIDTKRYMDALGVKISRRQAERDLASFRGLRAVGRTKGRHYVRRKG